MSFASSFHYIAYGLIENNLKLGVFCYIELHVHGNTTQVGFQFFLCSGVEWIDKLNIRIELQLS